MKTLLSVARPSMNLKFVLKNLARWITHKDVFAHLIPTELHGSVCLSAVQVVESSCNSISILTHIFAAFVQWHQQPHSRHRASLGSCGEKSPENPIDFKSIRQVRYINRTAREAAKKKNIQKHTNSREATKPSIMSSTRTRNPPNLSPETANVFPASALAVRCIRLGF